MQLIQFDAQSLNIDGVITSFDKHGYVIIRNAIDRSSLMKLRRELEPYFEERAVSKAEFFGHNTKRIEALFSKSSISQKMAMDPAVLKLADHLLKPNCSNYQINLTQGIRINPGEKAQIIHPDSAMFPISNKPFEFMMNALWAYSDFTKENGATAIVPGSHKWEEGREPTSEEITYAAMPAGSVLIYAASLLHGGGANITNQTRTGIAISYCLGWLRQSENQYLSYPVEVAKHFGKELQRLIGYNVHEPNLGWVNGHDPIDLLTGEDNSDLGAQDFLTEPQKEMLKAYREKQEVTLTSHNLKAA